MVAALGRLIDDLIAADCTVIALEVCCSFTRSWHGNFEDHAVVAYFSSDEDEND